MIRIVLLVVICMFTVSLVAAQDSDWQSDVDGSMEYNCETLPIVISAIEKSDTKSFSGIGNLKIARLKDGTEISTGSYISTAVMILLSQKSQIAITTNDIFSAASAVCNKTPEVAVANTSNPVDEFNVIVKGNVNLRSCAGTQCTIVQTAKDSSILTVIAIDGDWYEVKLDDGTAFISSKLTTRGPDDIIKVDEPYFDAPTGCFIVFDAKRGDMDVNLILSGINRNDILVDIYRPKESRPLKVEAQLDKMFSDTNEPYILQYYSYNVSWPLNGRYELELTLDKITRKLAWEFETKGDYNIFIQCD